MEQLIINSMEVVLKKSTWNWLTSIIGEWGIIKLQGHGRFLNGQNHILRFSCNSHLVKVN